MRLNSGSPADWNKLMDTFGRHAVKVRFKKLHPNAIVPRYQREGDAGMDLHLLRAATVITGETVTLQTGIAAEIPPGYEGQIRGRSSLGSRGLQVVMGTIDSGFRGELRVSMYALQGYFELEAGDRIAQLVIAPVVHAEIEEVDELSPSERGTGGFGSTGRGQ